MGLTINRRILDNGPCEWFFLFAGAFLVVKKRTNGGKCMTYVALFCGGIIGGIFRYVLDAIIPGIYLIPLNTLIINLSGAFALGLFYGIADVRNVKPWFHVGFGAGVIGTFTTFSTFCFDLVNLSSIHLWLAAIYALGTILGGPLLALLGDQIVVAVTSRTAEEQKELSV